MAGVSLRRASCTRMAHRGPAACGAAGECIVMTRVTTATRAATRAARLVSLDAFRGATIALMVLVNTPGDGANVYAPLEHADWNGWTPTDVVFPSFLWIVGLTLTLSFQKRIAAGATRADLLRQAFRRAAILFGLGLFLYGYPRFDLATWRILGVLQRIAICYLAGAAIWLTTGLRGRIAWTVGLLASYWALMTLVPVPGFGAGNLSVEGNFAHYVDRLVLGSHNYAETKTWDPEGIVSTLPAIATVLFGMFAADVLALRRSLTERLGWMLAIGVGLLVAGLVCDQWLPINKKLWTSSFALFMAGLDFVLLAGFAWIVDGLKWQRAVRPFVILGMNAIAIYMLSELLVSTLWMLDWQRPIYRTVFAPLASPVNASLLWAVSSTLLMFLIAWVMYRRKVFIKV
jgi:predicted acyltransferase